ncbi:MAG: tRNA (adenosine(37)-N6)-dimethylallyltransferase MiaA [Coriobacteriia bacterium]|nr:MAG: tRNA (adenosine(37)-N6)-dimethylallyltransferase MiaA [Coriobacteriia bacterium]
MCDKVVCVQGATASGKSELAERVAAILGGEIISADSMQIYRGMDIGTAKVPASERAVAYHCIDILDPGEPYSAALFQHDARAAIEDIRLRGRLPIICGGTGFYVRAALDDMDFAPGDTENPVRLKYMHMLEELGSDVLHELLGQRDPESAALIHPHNVRRVIRAFEMLEEGESYAERKRAFATLPARISSIKLALDVERQMLYERIDKRVDVMIESGLVDEVRHLLDEGFRDGLTAPQAIGYKEIVAYLEGDITFDEAIAQVKQATRRYAKRQLSWLRRDSEIIWLHADEGITDTLVQRTIDEIERAAQT